MQYYTSKKHSCIHLLQYHVVLLERAVRGTLHDAGICVVPEHSIQCVFGSSGIVQTQYTGTSSTDFTVDFVARCHKILGPPLEWGPMGPHIINIWGPHRDFGAPFELVLLARREVAFITAIYPMQSCQNLPSIL